MGLTPLSESIAGKIPILYKNFELFFGGFSLVSTGFTDGVTLPAGSFVKVDEEARTATPVKTAVSVSGVDYRTVRVQKGHHFAVGDIIGHKTTTGLYPKAGPRRIATLTATSASYDTIITEPTALADKATAKGMGTANLGTVLYNGATRATAGAGGIKTVPNSVIVYDTLISTTLTEFVSALRRGTIYKKRIQSHVAGHLANLPETIQVTTSY